MGRNHQLDGLRGYASITVCFYHAILNLNWERTNPLLAGSIFDVGDSYSRAIKIGLAIFGGDTAVIVFLVISGAVLFRSLTADKTALALKAWNFTVRRFLRLYPALIVSLVVFMAALSYFITPHPIEMFLKNAVLYEASLNGATWTINVEMFAIPFLLATFIGYQIGKEIGMIAAVFAISYGLTLPFMSPYLIYFKNFWLCLALGALVPTRVGEFVARFSPRHAWVLFLVVMIVARHVMRNVADAIIVQQVFAAFLVCGVYYGRVGRFGAFLEAPISVFLGRISYSFYLFNVMFLQFMVQWMQTFPRAVERPLEFGIITAIAVCAVTIPVSYLSVIYIEDPAIRLGRKLTRDRSDSPGRNPSTGSTGRKPVGAAATASRSFSMGDGS